MYFAISYVGYKFRILTANFAPMVQEVIFGRVFSYNLRNQKEEKPRGVRQHCYKKKAATVGQNGRLSAFCNFFSF